MASIGGVIFDVGARDIYDGPADLLEHLPESMILRGAPATV